MDAALFPGGGVGQGHVGDLGLSPDLLDRDLQSGKQPGLKHLWTTKYCGASILLDNGSHGEAKNLQSWTATEPLRGD